MRRFLIGFVPALALAFALAFAWAPESPRVSPVPAAKDLPVPPQIQPSRMFPLEPEESAQSSPIAEPPAREPRPEIRALRWLAAQQSADGAWPGTDESPAGMVAVTGLAVMAFLSHINTHQDGELRQPMRRALAWLIRQQTAEGEFANTATIAGVRAHAIATWAFAEDYGMTDSSWVKAPAQRAITALGRRIGGDDAGELVGNLNSAILAYFAVRSARSANLDVDGTSQIIAERWGQFPASGDFLANAFGAWVRPSDPANIVHARAAAAVVFEMESRGPAELSPLELLLASDLPYRYGDHARFFRWAARVKKAQLADQHADGSWRPPGNESRIEFTAWRTIILGDICGHRYEKVGSFDPFAVFMK